MTAASARLVLAAFFGTVLFVASGSAAAPNGAKDNGIFGQSAAASGSAALPANFQDSVVFSGLTQPTVVRFASDGRVFVAEKSGLVKVFSSLSATTPTVVADLRAAVDNYWDRGLLGMALDPNFPTNPYVYVLYTYDAPIGGQAPVWNDACPTPPGPTTDGCVVSGRLARLHITGSVADSEQVLINDWCQQFPSHSIGSLNFGADGMLYVSGGDGASFNNTDYGQYGGSAGSPTQKNPCGDPPAGVGGTETPPTAEGGALRSQDVRTASDATGLDGAILRLDPSSGAGLADNPFGSSTDANAKRIVAYGLRNPFRFTFRPSTNEVWVGDVGWSDWEEIDRLVTPADSTADNFGWPCYEGAGRQPGYDGLNLTLCETLYASGPVVAPYYTYNHGAQVVSGETCPTGSSSIAGMAFYTGSSYPSSYNGALFFADYTRKCIWVMFPGADGLPDPNNRANFVSGGVGPVDLEIGPNGDLFYADYDGGTIRRVQYFASNQPPIASAAASPTSGPAPLTVSFDGSASYDPDGDPITYAWDLDGDGQFDDSTLQKPTFTYPVGTYQARLQVTDSHGASTTSAPITISSNNTAPTAVISSPPSTLTWKVGDLISFSGSGSDQQDGTLPASALSWTLAIEHCPSTCHEHVVQTWSGVASGSFNAPDHEYPSYLQLRLTATDSGGLSNTTLVNLYPITVNLTFQSSPSGLQLTGGTTTSATPFTKTVIQGSANTISAPSPQTLGGSTYVFSSWSDGGAQSHTVVANTSATYTATYQPPADLSLTKSVALSGNTATWTLAASNLGPNAAQAVVVTDVLPSRLVFVSASSGCTYSSGTRTVRCTSASLASGTSVSFAITTTLTNGNGWITNTAQVTSSTPDSNTGNNSATVRIRR